MIRRLQLLLIFTTQIIIINDIKYYLLNFLYDICNETKKI